VLKTRIGLVVSDKMSKTRVVVVERSFRHSQYERVVKRTTRFKAHDERNEAHGRLRSSWRPPVQGQAADQEISSGPPEPAPGSAI
jgi:hypothetical protein